MNGLTAKKIVEHMNKMHSLVNRDLMNMTDCIVSFIGYLEGLEDFNLIDKNEIKLFSDLNCKTLFELDKKKMEAENPGVKYIIDNSSLEKWYDDLYKTVKEAV